MAGRRDIHPGDSSSPVSLERGKAAPGRRVGERRGLADRDLFLGVLATQAGLLTPAQVMCAASTWVLARDGRSLLDHLVDAGALTPEQRDRVLALAGDAAPEEDGSSERTLHSLHGGQVPSHTLGSAIPPGSTANAPAADIDAVPVERDGQYARLGELGRGAQSIVWRAFDRFLGREVALKELSPTVAGDAPGVSSEGRARLLREAKLTAQLDHPGIATILELVQRPDGTLCAAQKLVRGKTLKRALAECRKLGQRLALLPHLVGVAQTMAYAHARSVVHRDLKPSNIMVGPGGETVVLDWGLAKRRGETEASSAKGSPEASPELTQVGVALGTPSYMSPEQARGDLTAIGERSDVFGLGAMLYELLTGRPPFQGVDNAQVIERVLLGHITPVRVLCPDAPRELAAIAERALRSDPAERYPDAGAFASELLVYQAGGRVQAYRYGSVERVRKFVRRNRQLSASIVAGVLILLGGAAALGVQRPRAQLDRASVQLDRAPRTGDVGHPARTGANDTATLVQQSTAAASFSLVSCESGCARGEGAPAAWAPRSPLSTCSLNGRASGCQ